MAKAAGANAPVLYRLLRALASVGVFYQHEDGRFGQSPMSTYLRTGLLGVRATVIFLNEESYRAWGELLHNVKTGESAFEHAFGMAWFPYLDQNPAAAKAFHDGLSSNSAQIGALTAAAYDFSGFRKIVDVGGGFGGLLSSILTVHPNLRGVLFDRATIIASAREQIDTAGVSERCELVAGDFFEGVPASADAYIMSFILHDWDDDRDLVILRNCHRAMGEQGKLLVVEMILPPGNEPSFAKLADLNVMVFGGGAQERTEAEYRDLLARAGFKLVRVMPTPGLQSVLEAVPV